MDALDIAKHWMISPDQVKNTVRKTTQRGIIMVMNPHMSLWYPNNDQMLRYHCLPHPVFTDTIIAGTVSNFVNKNAQLYGTSFGWTRLFPMKIKNDAHYYSSAMVSHLR